MYAQIAFLGGFREQGRSCLAIEYRGKVALLDVGIKKVLEAGYYGVPPYLDLIDIAKLELIAVSHLHEDHIAVLPALVRRGFSGPIYMTRPTLELGKNYLYRWARQFEEDGRKLYTAEDVDRALSMVKTVEPGKVVQEGDFELCFFVSGHALGSVSIDLRAGDLEILYLADIDKGSNVLRDYEIPFSSISPQLVVINASYGANVLDRESLEHRFVSVLREVAERGGLALVPLTAVGRGQETLAIIAKHIDMLEKFDLFVEESIVKGFDTLAQYSEYTKPGIENIRRAVLSIPKLHIFKRGEVMDIAKQRSCIVLAPDLMLMRGPSKEIFMAIKDDPRSAVVITGYQAPGTLGRRLLESRSMGVVRIDGEVVKFSVDVCIVPLRMHLDLRDNIALLQRLRGEPLVVLHHGEEPKSLDLAHYLGTRVLDPPRVVLPHVPSTMFLQVGSHGTRT